MRVDDVEQEFARELHDLVRERKHVLGLAKEGVGRSVDAMEREARLVVAKPKGRLRADEMHLVPAPGQRLGELRRHDAATADRRVTDHPDMHAYLFKQMFTNHRLGHHDALRKPDAR